MAFVKFKHYYQDIESTIQLKHMYSLQDIFYVQTFLKSANNKTIFKCRPTSKWIICI